MNKNYKTTQDTQHQSQFSEPVATYSVRPRHHSPIINNTMSVDEYFDELISQVRRDYANI